MSGLDATSAGRVVVDRLGFAESPRWHDGCLWLSDIAGGRVLTVDARGTVTTICEVPGEPSGLGWLPDGRLLIVSMRDRRVLRREPDGRLVEHADLAPIVSTDVNDLAVSADGHAYISSFGYEPGAGVIPIPTGLVLVRPDGSAEMQEGELFRPNGIVITPDGATLIVAETRVHRLTAFTIGADARLGDARPFADLPSGSWADGICLDAAGAVWVADPKGGRVFRVFEGGRIDTVLPSPELPTVACVLGGTDRRTLFLAQGHVRPMAEGRADPCARVIAVPVDVPGAGFP
jgi:sugar lactone lactonase YvrE